MSLTGVIELANFNTHKMDGSNPKTANKCILYL